MRRRNKIIIVMPLLTVGFLALNAVVPFYEKCHKGYNCRLCAVQKSEDTFYLCGVRVRRKTGELRRTTHTELYDKYIAEPHQHQWAGGGFGSYVRYLFTGGIHRDGMHGGGYPLYQPRLTRDVLSVMDLLKDESLKFRRELYHDLIGCKEPEHYEKVRQLLEDMCAAPENPSRLYHIYLQQKTTHGVIKDRRIEHSPGTR